MNFIKTPYLPSSNVDTCIAGNGIIPFENALSEFGINVLITKENELVTRNIANHADLAVNYIGDGVIFADKSQLQLVNTLKNKGFKCNFIKNSVENDYPNDCLLNCIVTDKLIVCNSSCTAEEILIYAQKTGKKLINVKQGYVKCSVCPVTENAFITDDVSIYKALLSEKIDTLLVEKGSVILNGYNYGFIGGCSGKISKNIIVFFGDIKKHSCYDSIKGFASNYNIDLLSLGNSDLIDIGSLIPISEKEL